MRSTTFLPEAENSIEWLATDQQPQEPVKGVFFLVELKSTVVVGDNDFRHTQMN